MKKHLLFILALIISTGIMAQTELLNETFDNPEATPTDWTIIDNDGDGNEWIMNSYEEEVYIVSESWIDPDPVNPDNYLISPVIDLTDLNGTITLNYNVAAAGASYFSEYYSVMISTTGMNPTDFTEIFNETLTELEADGNWGNRELDLTEFIGEQIYIAIRHHNCSDWYKLMIDNFNVMYDPEIGIHENDQSDINIYPNPFNETINIKSNSKITSIEVIDLTGKTVYKTISEEVSIDLSELHSGLYFAKINNQEGTQIIKIQKI